MTAERRSGTGLLLVVTLVFTAVMLGLGYANKARCVGPQFNQFGQSEPDLGVRISRDDCYSDIQYLWVGRAVNQHPFPYLHGSYDPVAKQISGGTLEYPVLTGMLIYLTGLPAANDAGFLLYNAIVLAICGLFIAFLLCRLAGIRAWWWALAPPLVFYAFHNWDLVAAACVVAAFSLVAGSDAWRAGADRSVADGAGADRSVSDRAGADRAGADRSDARRRVRRLLLAGVWLGIGGAFKLYPLMFALPLALWVGLGRRDAVGSGLRTTNRRLAAGVLLAAAGVFLLANLPFMIAGFQGWWASFQFQWSRPIDPSTNSIWFWATRPDSDSDNAGLQATLGRWSTVSTAVGLLVAVLAGWWRSRPRGPGRSSRGAGWWWSRWSGPHALSRPAWPRGHADRDKACGTQGGRGFGGGRGTADRGYPWLQVSAAMLCAYLLLNKVHSPQYVLWLLPFFVLLRIRAGWIIAYFVADAAVGIGFFRWQYLMLQGVPSGVLDSFALQAVMIGVWGRAALLVGLFFAFLSAESVLDSAPELSPRPKLSPTPNLSPTPDQQEPVRAPG